MRSGRSSRTTGCGRCCPSCAATCWASWAKPRGAAKAISVSPNGLRNFLNGSAPRSATRAKLERWLASQERPSRPPGVGQLVRLLSELSADLSPQQTEQLGRAITALLADAYTARRLSSPRWVQDLLRHYAPRPGN